MKLIDYLVRTLPGIGGWKDRDINVVIDNTSLVINIKGDEATGLIDSRSLEVITREQYEYALAASQKVEWGGEGLPPVGCECEISFAGESYRKCTVLFTSKRTVLVAYETSNDDEDNEEAFAPEDVQFRPIRSETDKKRDEAAKGLIEYLDKETDIDNVFSIKDVIGFYDAIAAGKIPHIRID